MKTSLYIVNEIAPLATSAKVVDAQLLFNELTYTHFPVLNDKTYVGCISEADVRCFETEKKLESYVYALEGFFVRTDANWLDILESFAQNHSNIMPVLDDANNYQGYFELRDIMNLFNETPFLSEPGNILIVEKGVLDYSFSEVSQIVESNNAKLLGLFISNMENDVIQITLKINDSDINNIVQTFRRYSYNIVSKHHEDSFLNNLKERSQYLEKYLNI
ncbi:CBS domain-containing protein [Aquimarina sp. MMG015]|uniref:CBS domain-containing protein n=1 Tax=Aquimarina TaxID=290174 RepID=UPI0004116375|nr:MULTISPECIES: CBS domain-containing protein [Aquimarina]AXT57859.1 CBS domain-containing protein [Aquimarina sp. AD1]MBQ4803198.1 CBS domain-containing protein [Aquimarina sp. MMG015]RKN34982.1 CBS domain-containing protein [Aquimarina sp. AD1]